MGYNYEMNYNYEKSKLFEPVHHKKLHTAHLIIMCRECKKFDYFTKDIDHYVCSKCNITNGIIVKNRYVNNVGDIIKPLVPNELFTI